MQGKFLYGDFRHTENHPYVASSDILFIVRWRRLERTGFMATSETVAPQNSYLQAPDRNSQAVLSEKKPSCITINLGLQHGVHAHVISFPIPVT